MKWTEKELEEQLRDPRKKKSFKQLGTKCFHTHNMVREVSRRSGYQFEAVQEVIRAYTKLIEETVIEKREIVIIGELVTLHPMVKKAKIGVNLNGGRGTSLMITPPRWHLKCIVNQVANLKFKEIIVTRKQVDNLYKEEKRK